MPTSKSAYSDSRASDTDFRRTWDKAEYAEKAKKEQDERREEAKARYEAKLEGKKWHKPVDLKSLDETTSRGQRLDVSSMVGKSTLVPAGAGVGRRGRGAGFYCEACDLTYKDNVQFIEHLNSKQHLIQTGQSGEVKRATLAEVRERIEWLKQKKRQQEEEEKKLRIESLHLCGITLDLKAQCFGITLDLKAQCFGITLDLKPECFGITFDLKPECFGRPLDLKPQCFVPSFVPTFCTGSGRQGSRLIEIDVGNGHANNQPTAP
ncbi:hypothetical protein DV737_g3977, partial [Chaetothyriales sp. CBS 132003]